jgi:hypothetical protein
MFETGSDAQRLDTHLRITRIIIGAMMMGIVSFLAVVIFVTQQREPNQDSQSLVSYMAVGGLALALVTWFLIPDLVVKGLVGQIAAGTWKPPKNAETEERAPLTDYPTDASKLLLVNQTRAIIATALLEGAAFFGLVAYLVEGQLFVLAVPGVVLALLALTFPARERVVQWAEVQQVRINDMRSEGRV